MLLGLVVALGASATFLFLSGPEQRREQGPAQPDQQPDLSPTAARTLGGAALGELLVRSELTETTTLSDPEITTVKAPLDTPNQWCDLLTAADVLAATGFEQRGAPETGMMCTHYLTGDPGYLLVSAIPAAQGMPYLLRGNTAIVFQRDPTACEVSVALNHGGGVLDIDIRGVLSTRLTPPLAPPMALCDVAAHLATRAFDRLPNA